MVNTTRCEYNCRQLKAIATERVITNVIGILQALCQTLQHAVPKRGSQRTEKRIFDKTETGKDPHIPQRVDVSQWDVIT